MKKKTFTHLRYWLHHPPQQCSIVRKHPTLKDTLIIKLDDGTQQIAEKRNVRRFREADSTSNASPLHGVNQNL